MSLTPGRSHCCPQASSQAHSSPPGSWRIIVGRHRLAPIRIWYQMPGLPAGHTCHETEIKSMSKLRRVDVVSKHLHADRETVNGNEFPLRRPGSKGKQQLLPIQAAAAALERYQHWRNSTAALKHSNSEPNVDLENQYYNSKALKEGDPKAALSSLQKVLELEGEKGKWGFKALKQIIK
ncbi:hypothetical protein MC885_007585 [Smutsia gigantea]|nr:hypothetical protein MC885_007585 [Smutsia gigantea]